MNEQIDIAVDLGVVAPPLPEILSLRQLVEGAPPQCDRRFRGLPRRKIFRRRFRPNRNG